MLLERAEAFVRPLFGADVGFMAGVGRGRAASIGAAPTTALGVRGRLLLAVQGPYWLSTAIVLGPLALARALARPIVPQAVELGEHDLRTGVADADAL